MKRGTIEHPKTIALSIRLRIPRYAAVGLLESLWHWCARYAIKGDIGRWANQQIAQGVAWDGDPDELIAALIETRWLDEVAGPRLVVHDIASHADNTWRQCLKDAGLTFWSGATSGRVADSSRSACASGIRYPAFLLMPRAVWDAQPWNHGDSNGGATTGDSVRS